MESTYTPYIRSLIMESMRELQVATSSELLNSICEIHGLEPIPGLRDRMLRACKSMVAELEMTLTETQYKTPIYTIKLKE